MAYRLHIEMKLQRRRPGGQAITCWLAAASLGQVVAALKIDAAGSQLPVATAPPSPYDKNGLDWVDGMCFSRERQSPINFDDHIKDPPSDILKYHYEPLQNVKLQMRAGGGLLWVDTSHLQVGEVVFNGAPYPLVRIDFHAGSEHLLKGKRYSMEIQLVHRKIDNPLQSLVIAVPVWSETVPVPSAMSVPNYLEETRLIVNQSYFPPLNTEVDFNAVLQQFLTRRLPTQEGMITDVVIPMQKPLDLGFFVQNPMLPGSGEYIQYAGSLTTPPCSDTTTWFVRRRPMIASDGQTKAFADAVFRLTNRHGNFRAVMPVNQRTLKVYRAQWVSSVPLGVKRLPLGPNARTDKEFQAQRLADQAKELSQDAVDYMSDFGTRLRRSARVLQHHLGQVEDLTTPPPSNHTEDEWDKAVRKLQGAMQGIVGGVQATVDKSMRKQTMKVHKRAAVEAERARKLTTAWTAPGGLSQGVPR